MKWLQLFNSRPLVAAEPVGIAEKDVNEALELHHGKAVLQAVHWLIQRDLLDAMVDASDNRRIQGGDFHGGRMAALMELRAELQRRSGGEMKRQ